MLTKFLKFLLLSILFTLAFVHSFYSIIWFDIKQFCYLEYNFLVIILIVSIFSLMKFNIKYMAFSIGLYIIYFSYRMVVA